MTKICYIEKCENKITAKGLCNKHWKRQWRGGDPSTTKREQHRMGRTPEYAIWNSMKSRCLNPNTEFYKHYGGRGISISDKWVHSFINFINDVGMRPDSTYSIERINNEGNYEPGNVVWEKRSEQSMNRRSNIIHELNGDMMPLKKITNTLGLSYSLVYKRLKRGWTIEESLYGKK